MHEFEFLAVFISLVVGLWVTHILYGLARVIYSRHRQQVSAVDIFMESERPARLVAERVGSFSVVGSAAVERRYLPALMLHYFVLAAAGIAVANPRYQRFLAWYVFLTLVLWSLVVRRFLGS